MVSRTALICKRYAAGCTKTEPKILRPKNKEKEKNAPEIVRKGRNRVRFGCWREVQPVRKGTRTRSPNQNAPHSHATHEKSKPAKTQCFRRFCGRGRRTCLGCRLGRFAAERHWRSLTPRHALRRAQPCLVAESLCALTKNREASIVLASLFLAGAEGLEPSARGFGVDVGKRTGGTGEGQCCPVSNASPGEDGAGLVLWEIFRAKTGEKERKIPEKT